MTSENPTPAQIRRGRLTLVLIIAVFVLPMLVAGVARFTNTYPDGRKLHGEMLNPPGDLSQIKVMSADGSNYLWAGEKRFWRLAVVAPAGCTTECLKLSRDLDKVWRLFGSNADDVEILWIGSVPAGAPKTESLRVLKPTPELMAALPRVNDPEGVPVYVIDRAGFVILRYAPGTDPGFIRTDVSKLLKLI